MYRNKNVKFLTLVLIFTMLFSVIPAYAQESDEPKGSLVLIGGALETDNASIYNKFVELGGGIGKIKIAIIPAASSTPNSSGDSIAKDFISYGVPAESIKVFPLAVADDEDTENVDELTWAKNGFSEELAKEISTYNAVFFIGGDQLLIIKALVDEKGIDGTVLTEIRNIYKNGGVLAGTSAGTAIMTDPMIGSGTSIGALTQGVTYKDNWGVVGDNRVFLTKGLGFMPNAISDQHFLKRGRIGRLIVALFDQKINIGYGIDENTALVYKNKEVEVIGASGVIVVDISKAAKDPKNKNFSAAGIKLHYLESGDMFNTVTTQATVNKDKPTTSGIEYYTGNSLTTNILGIDTIKKVIADDLIDNTAKQAVGISFDMENGSSIANGTKFIFRKGEGTEGFWGKLNGIGSYSAVNVYLDIVPIKVRIISERVYRPR